jgi:RNA polymerase sigma-70 factor (ECF subfamily)
MRRSRDIARSKHSEADLVAETEANDEAPNGPGEARGFGISAWQFRLAVMRHHRLVYRVACALLRDPAEAEDVTQEAFLKLWQQGGPVRRPREWLVKVARHLCLDRLRSAHRMRTVGMAALDAVSLDADARDAGEFDSRPLDSASLATAVLDPAHEERGPAWHVQQSELTQRLRASIAALPEPQRSLVVLFDVHGLDGAACARILGINTNQVKVYLHRARRRLRRELESPE